MSFDPYREWFQIASNDRPPNHYDLLGLTRFETDGQAIEVAFEKRLEFVRQYQVGHHEDLSAEVTERLSEAFTELTHAQRKRDYDAGLRIRLALRETFASPGAQSTTQSSRPPASAPRSRDSGPIPVAQPSVAQPSAAGPAPSVSTAPRRPLPVARPLAPAAAPATDSRTEVAYAELVTQSGPSLEAVPSAKKPVSPPPRRAKPARRAWPLVAVCRFVGQMLAFDLRNLDRWLVRLVGEENTVLINFVRLLLVTSGGLALAYGAWSFRGWLAQPRTTRIAIVEELEEPHLMIDEEVPPAEAALVRLEQEIREVEQAESALQERKKRLREELAAVPKDQRETLRFFALAKAVGFEEPQPVAFHFSPVMPKRAPTSKPTVQPVITPVEIGAEPKKLVPPKPAKPATPLPSFAGVDVTEALQKAKEAHTAFAAIDNETPKADAGKTRLVLYESLAWLGNVATFADAGDKKAAVQMPAVRELLLEVGKNPDALKMIRAAGKRWLDDSQFRKNDGILLLSKVQSIRPRGEMFETVIEFFPGKEMSVFSRADPTDFYGHGNTLLVLGSMVDQPAERLKGFLGPEPKIILGGFPVVVPEEKAK